MVTQQTMRRDLNELCDYGLLARIHGSAVLASGVANLANDTRREMAVDEKEGIGRLVAEAIPDGAPIFIKIGTMLTMSQKHSLSKYNYLDP